MIDEWKKGAKYWDHAWNPMIGCRKVSEGCANCYAERLAAHYPELQDASGGFAPHPPKNLKNQPRSGVVFVGNMTDIFGEWNSNEQIVAWLGMLHPVTAINLILTKRAERLLKLYPNLPKSGNRFYGVTAETQTRLEERCAGLAAFNRKCWLSVEPLLERMDLTVNDDSGNRIIDLVSWVVVGAESGPKRRPCSLDWVRQIVEQCREAQVPVFVKQLDIDGKLVSDIEKFPEDLQIRQVPWK